MLETDAARAFERGISFGLRLRNQPLLSTIISLNTDCGLFTWPSELSPSLRISSSIFPRRKRILLVSVWLPDLQHPVAFDSLEHLHAAARPPNLDLPRKLVRPKAEANQRLAGGRVAYAGRGVVI